MRTSIVVLVAAAASLQAQGPSPGAAATVDTALIAAGKKIFEGKAAGALCFACHGPTGKGTPGVAPDLTDAKWLHGDGSLEFIEALIKTGVPKPKQSAAPMLPMGGASLKPDQVKAVAAYVHSLSHPMR